MEKIRLKFLIKFWFYFSIERCKTKQAPGVSSSLWESLNKHDWGFHMFLESQCLKKKKN